MNPKIIIVQNVPFAELIAFEDLQTSNSIFDIITTDEINENSYCSALINKVFDLNPSKFSEFISYQTTQVKDNIKWLNKFEKLLTVNENLFTTNGNYTRLTKLINLIEKKREQLQSSSIKPTKPALAKKYINAENDDRYFSFYELKKQLELFDNDDDKILLLTREKHQYKQANIEFINRNTPIFDEQCRQEIEQIYELKKPYK